MISLKNLPFKNLKGYVGRTAALLFFSLLMTTAFFGGMMVVGGVRGGLDAVKSRLGADIIVTPKSAENDFDAQTVLVVAEPGYFYMDRSKLDEIAGVEGIDQVSPQLYLASAKAGCCSARLQMIAFDPSTDFVVRPWLEDLYSGTELGLMDVIVGSNVTVNADNELLFYDKECHIVGQFAPTGSTLDSCVYMTVDTVKDLITSSFMKGLNKYEEFDPDSVISSVMIRVKPGVDIETAARNIRDSVSDVNVVTSTNMVAGIGENLGRISNTAVIVTIVFWLIGMLMTILIFSMMINERKMEFASLIAMGASRKIVTEIVLKEALSVNLGGGALGIIISAVVLIMFRSLIGQELGAGFVLPGAGSMFIAALAALVSVVLAAGISSLIAVRKIGKMDASLVLREGA